MLHSFASYHKKEKKISSRRRLQFFLFYLGYKVQLTRDEFKRSHDIFSSKVELQFLHFVSILFLCLLASLQFTLHEELKACQCKPYHTLRRSPDSTESH